VNDAEDFEVRYGAATDPAWIANEEVLADMPADTLPPPDGKAPEDDPVRMKQIAAVMTAPELIRCVGCGGVERPADRAQRFSDDSDRGYCGFCLHALRAVGFNRERYARMMVEEE
jgi:hypothetical protein